MQGLLESEAKITVTDRQLEVLNLMAKGLTGEAIANDLGISINTVKYHRKMIFRLLEVTSVSQAIVKAISLKII